MKPFQRLSNRNIPRAFIDTLMTKETVPAKILLEVEELLKKTRECHLVRKAFQIGENCRA